MLTQERKFRGAACGATGAEPYTSLSRMTAFNVERISPDSSSLNSRKCSNGTAVTIRLRSGACSSQPRETSARTFRRTVSRGIPVDSAMENVLVGR